jgi:hypothetical protein
MSPFDQPVTALDADRLVRLLAGSARRRVVATMILGAVTTPDIARTAGLDVRTVIDALDRLCRGGLVEQGGDDTWALLESAFERAARSAAPPTRTEFPDEPSDRRQVLDLAFDDGRLVHLPSKRSKRLIVLDELAQQFEPGARYAEQEVNTILRRFDDDTATLRRYLVDEGFLDRSGGEYWRSGGSVL